MNKVRLYTTVKKISADTFTPVGIYLKLRDKFKNCILLESSDYHGNQNSLSYICFNPMASIKKTGTQLAVQYPDKETNIETITQRQQVTAALDDFLHNFTTTPLDLKFIYNGLFGYVTYDAVQAFEDITFKAVNSDPAIPELFYALYEYLIVINHFNDEMYLIKHSTTTFTNEAQVFDPLLALLTNKTSCKYAFHLDGNETSNYTDEEFMEMVKKGKYHCKRGDVFQIVLSRRFQQSFTGDEFNVYRALRNINPSPYLFYFDYGSYKLFGSSPEAQLVIENGKASINPIAGTFKRTGNDAADADLAEQLKLDKKENAEHVMLVDLARNDLSRNCVDVHVERYKEIQYYSHVIHLVSKVSGTLKDASSAVKIMADTFPAGTLSGAPKHKAMQLIDTYEKTNRSFYGGCIGFIGFNGNFNHAIIIRSFLSKNNCLYYQAGAGIVISSDETSELNEVNNKLFALKQALTKAQELI